MPPKKRQKSVEASDALSETAAATTNNTQSAKGGKDGKDTKEAKKAPYEYICIHRPFFDLEGENWRQSKNGEAELLEDEEIYAQMGKPIFEAEKKAGIWQAPAAEHPEHKWVMMYSAYEKYDLQARKAKYCDPDMFNMYLYNDWHGWGLQECIENQLVDFDKAFREKGTNRLNEMWAVVSAMGHWFNTAHGIEDLYGNEDGPTTCNLIGLVGCALITTLAVVEDEGELKPDSKLLDLPLVIGEFIEFTYDLADMGIEGECMEWRKEAIAYVKKGRLDLKKGVAASELRMKLLEEGDEKEDADKENDEEETGQAKKSASPAAGQKRKLDETQGGSKDKWQWDAKFKAYKKKRHPKMGGQHYDITKMSKKARADAAFDKKDPLAGVSAKDLKENLIDIA
ncbi:hypothetical protein NX059_008407 [Plenodomus lindquistii]|nr:hypothetical protein NX059_008407 [Plenodomus lindquistii]